MWDFKSPTTFVLLIQSIARSHCPQLLFYMRQLNPHKISSRLPAPLSNLMRCYHTIELSMLINNADVHNPCFTRVN